MKESEFLEPTPSHLHIYTDRPTVEKGRCERGKKLGTVRLVGSIVMFVALDSLNASVTPSTSI